MSNNTKSLPFGCAIATKDIPVHKEFYVDSKGNAHGPSYTSRNWGKLKPGRVIGTKAARNSNSCAAGIHSWRGAGTSGTKYKFGTSANEIWSAVIPKGTFYHKDSKFRADCIRLVKRLRRIGSRAK